MLARATTIVGLVRTLAHELFLTDRVDSTALTATAATHRRPPLVHRPGPCEHAAGVAKTDVTTVRAGR
jgi:hypothetical protein